MIQPARQLHSVALRYRQTPSRGTRKGPKAILSWQFARYVRDAVDTSESNQQRQRLEAVLLLAREPLNSRKLAHYAGLADGTAARTGIRQLNQVYDENGHAFRVEEIAGGFQLLTRPQFGPWLRRLEHVPAEVRLSAPAMETLAVVAYRQPVLRAEIEAVRGVSCGEILRQLMDRDLVRIGGRSTELGRPYLYTTTRRFLQLFGLQTLDQLPRAECPHADSRDPLPVADAKPAGGPTDDQQQEENADVNTTSSHQPPANDFDDEQSFPLTATVVSTTDPANAYEEEDFDDDVEDDNEDDLENDSENDDENDDEDENDDDDDDDDEDDDDDDYLDDEWEEVDDDEEIDDEDLDDDELEGDWEEVDDDELDEDEYEDDEWSDDYEDDEFDDDEDDDDDERNEKDDKDGEKDDKD